MVNIGSLSTGGRVTAVKADLGERLLVPQFQFSGLLILMLDFNFTAKVTLTNPVCTEIGEKIALSRRVEKHWRLVLQFLWSVL